MVKEYHFMTYQLRNMGWWSYYEGILMKVLD